MHALLRVNTMYDNLLMSRVGINGMMLQLYSPSTLRSLFSLQVPPGVTYGKVTTIN